MANKIDFVGYSAGQFTGTTVTSAATTANTAIPNDSTGTTAKWVILTGTGNVHVKLGPTNTVTATANDLMVGTVPIVINTRGNSFIAYIQETAAAKLNIAPVEF
jgi:uncharacterized alpha/beta hydrolase family protein